MLQTTNILLQYLQMTYYVMGCSACHVFANLVTIIIIITKVDRFSHGILA